MVQYNQPSCVDPEIEATHFPPKKHCILSSNFKPEWNIPSATFVLQTGRRAGGQTGKTRMNESNPTQSDPIRSNRVASHRAEAYGIRMNRPASNSESPLFQTHSPTYEPCVDLPWAPPPCHLPHTSVVQLCMYVCMYVYVCVCIYIPRYIYICVHIHKKQIKAGHCCHLILFMSNRGRYH